MGLGTAAKMPLANPQAVDAVGSLDDGAGVWARALICGFGLLRATGGACMIHPVVSFLRVYTGIGCLSLNADRSLTGNRIH